MPSKKAPEYSRLTIVQNIVMTAIFEVLLRVFGLKKSWKLLLWIVPVVDDKRRNRGIIRSQLLAMKWARQRKLTFGNCLAQSLVLWWQLRRRGLSGNLVIGVQRKIDFRAHAWVEFENTPLNAGFTVHDRYNSIAVFDHPDAIK